MRQDIIVALSVSALLHGGVLLEGVLFPNHPAVRRAIPKEVVQIFENQKYEPEPPEKVELSTDPQRPIDIAPRSQIDVPQPTTEISFIQPVELPPPDSIKATTPLFTIPERSGPWTTSAPVFTLSDLDHIPEARYQTPPQYPFEMKSKGITGEVLVDFIVDSNGAVQNAFAAKSSQREFEQAAVQAVSKWKFKPGRKGGHTVNTHMQVPIVFNLNGE